MQFAINAPVVVGTKKKCRSKKRRIARFLLSFCCICTNPDVDGSSFSPVSSQGELLQVEAQGHGSLRPTSAWTPAALCPATKAPPPPGPWSVREESSLALTEPFPRPPLLSPLATAVTAPLLWSMRPSTGENLSVSLASGRP